jgi:hypothetical protein
VSPCGEQQRHPTATKRHHYKFRKGSTPPRHPLHTPDSPTSIVVSLYSTQLHLFLSSHSSGWLVLVANSKTWYIHRSGVALALRWLIVAPHSNLALLFSSRRAFVFVTACFGWYLVLRPCLFPNTPPTHHPPSFHCRFTRVVAALLLVVRDCVRSSPGDIPVRAPPPWVWHRLHTHNTTTASVIATETLFCMCRRYRGLHGCCLTVCVEPYVRSPSNVQSGFLPSSIFLN